MPITGITDLYGQTAAGRTGAGALASRQGLPGYAPAQNPYGQGGHGQWGDVAGPAYAAPGWNAVLRREANLDVYTADFTLTDDEDYTGLGEGSVTEQPDQTPYPATRLTGYSGRGRHAGYEETGTAPDPGIASHAGPYPRSWTQAGRTRPEPGTELDDQWTEQEARRVVHEVDYGASRPGQAGMYPPAVTRRDEYFTSQGETLLTGSIPGQLRYQGGDASIGGMAARQHSQQSDNVQGGGTSNAWGYGEAHFMGYRQQVDAVPFNYQWLDASERPFIPKGQATNMTAGQTFTGPDNPYGESGDQTDYSADTYQPAMVEGPASPYAAPPDPTMGQGYPDAGEDVFAEW